MNNAFFYDVFLSHNSHDKEQVGWIAERLEDEADLRVFLDIWNLVPGEPWQEDLENALSQSSTTAVFLGPAGISSWHNKEMRDALNRQASDPNRRVIPVILPGGDSGSVEVPAFLSQLTWVDFRNGLDDDKALHRLISGITGQAPGRGPGKTPPRRPPPAQPAPPTKSEAEEKPSGEIQIGNISGIQGSEINIAGGDIQKTAIDTGGGAYIGGQVDTGGGDFTGRDYIIHESRPQDEGLEVQFKLIYSRIESRPEDPDVGNEEIRRNVENIETEVKKGEQANGNKLKRWLGNLSDMAPDIFMAVADSLTNPESGLKPAIKLIADKAKNDSGSL